MPTPKSPRRWFTRTSRVEQVQARRHRPQLEWCEPRTLLTAFTVNALTDSGAGSGTTGDLRYCITQADKDTTNDTITITVQGKAAHGMFLRGMACRPLRPAPSCGKASATYIALSMKRLRRRNGTWLQWFGSISRGFGKTHG